MCVGNICRQDLSLSLMAPLLFGVRLSLNNFVQEKIDDIDLDKTTTEELKSILSKMPAVNLEVTDIGKVFLPLNVNRYEALKSLCSASM